MSRLVRMFWVSNRVSSEEVVGITLQLLLPMLLLLFSHSVMSNSLQPLDCNKPVSSILHYLPEFAQNSCPLNQWSYVMHILLKVKVKSHSRVWLFAAPWTVAHQAPPSMKFSRQECWSGLPFPSLGDLPNPRIKPVSLVSPALADRFFTTSTLWEAQQGGLGSIVTSF